ncbi:MAG: Inosine-5'-monophosphate dehydrogenase [uncultured Chloroflexia bacterium]|uniref:Inosine-5'-monophosphate dehydrogenase n=1 Tax=uncultured Chloroflexia bacterium TaxID=1672391 RepID=A0A6J4NIC6_9CHLR|nr:MAG: Inosine-5'-monophosphate dehydrogenase [uncultured Chloroflexia bacterium]
MLVSQIIKQKGSDVFAVSPGETLSEAARQLNDKRVGALVVKDGDTVVGIVSERDIVRELVEGGSAALEQPVGEHMTRDVIFAAPHETVDALLGRMTDRRVRTLPVVSGQGELCGLVSIGDLVKHKIYEVEAEAQTLKNYIVAG